MILTVETPASTYYNCVGEIDTNPAAGECGDEDSKTYCPGIGKVRDAVLELVT